MSVFVVIPAYNEASTIGPVVRDIFSLYKDARVVVVDDGSTDQTSAIAKEAGAAVLLHLLNRGQGAALKTGTDYALSEGAEIIVHFDADGQFEAKEIGELVALVKEGQVDVVLGSRFLKKNQIPWSKRCLVLPLARLINFLFTGLWLSDAHNGFRVFSRRAAETIKITQDRMAHNSEIVSQIKKHRLAFKEMPVTVYYHYYGQGPLGGLKIIKDLILQKLL